VILFVICGKMSILNVGNVVVSPVNVSVKKEFEPLYVKTEFGCSCNFFAKKKESWSDLDKTISSEFNVSLSEILSYMGINQLDPEGTRPTEAGRREILKWASKYVERKYKMDLDKAFSMLSNPGGANPLIVVAKKKCVKVTRVIVNGLEDLTRKSKSLSEARSTKKSARPFKKLPRTDTPRPKIGHPHVLSFDSSDNDDFADDSASFDGCE